MRYRAGCATVVFPTPPPKRPYACDMKPAVDESCVMLDGPWAHRFVSANGNRFHIVEAGTGPLVLLLHGFPEFWRKVL